jgi:RNA polymerase primary sigma factor
VRDDLREYREKIAGYPSLDDDELDQLGLAVQAAKYALKLLGSLPEFDVEHGEELQAQIDDGRKAEERIVKSCLGLVIAQVEQCSQPVSSVADLVQAGSLGLVRAVREFDFQHFMNFKAHAAWWIRVHLKDAMPTLERCDA